MTFISLSFMQGKIAGYAIFDWKNQANGMNDFDITRTYFQYTDNLSDNLFFKVRFDVGRLTDNSNPDEQKLRVFLKNSYVDWTCNTSNTLSLGLIGTNSYSIQENTWGNRFIEKSPLDKGQLTNTADFGIGYSRSFSDINLNIQLLNGEGYGSKEQNSDKTVFLRLLYGEKQLNKNNGFNIGTIYTFVPTSDNDSDILMGVFTGWSNKDIRLGFEANQVDFESNTKSAHALYLKRHPANHTL